MLEVTLPLFFGSSGHLLTCLMNAPLVRMGEG